MKIFLVDYENVNSAGLEGIDLIDDDDKVIVFYGPNSTTISFKMMEHIRNCNINLELHELKHSHQNALDFKLTVYLGYLISELPNAEFYIISRDKGYQSAIDFSYEHLIDDDNMRIEKCPSIAAALCDKSCRIEISVSNNKNSDDSDSINSHVSDSIVNDNCEIMLAASQINSDALNKKHIMEIICRHHKKSSDSERKQIYDTVLNFLKNTDNKDEFYRKLTKKYKKDRGLQYYNLFKNEYNKLKSI